MGCPIGLTIAFCILNGRSLFSSKMNYGTDSAQYLTTLVQFDENLKQGWYFPEWAPDIGFGHGHPIFVFLPPGLYWLASIFVSLGFLKTTALNAALLAGIFSAALGMMAWAKRWVGAWGAVAAAAAYVYAPYFHTNLYVRGAYGEFMTFAVFPWVLWGLDGILLGRGGGLNRLAAGFGLALVFLLHNPMGLIFAPFALFYVLMFAAAGHAELKSVGKAVLALALGAGTAAFFWVPALLLKDQVESARLLKGYLAYYNHFVYLHQLFYSRWGYNILWLGSNDGMSQKFGEFQLAALFFCAWVLLRHGLRGAGVMEKFRDLAATPQKCWIASLVIAAVISLFFATAYSKFVWDRIALLQYLQFGMRFLAPGTVVGAGLVGLMSCAASRWLMERLRYKVHPAAVPCCFSVLVVLVNLPHASPPHKYKFGDAEHSPAMIARYGYGANNKDEFQPKGVWIVPAYAKKVAQVASGAVEVLAEKREPLSSEATFDVRSENGEILLDRYDFRGWEVILDGKPARRQPANPYGRIQIAAAKGKHTVTARYVGLPERTVMKRISWAFFCGLLLWSLVGARQSVVVEDGTVFFKDPSGRGIK